MPVKDFFMRNATLTGRVCSGNLHISGIRRKSSFRWRKHLSWNEERKVGEKKWDFFRVLHMQPANGLGRRLNLGGLGG